MVFSSSRLICLRGLVFFIVGAIIRANNKDNMAINRVTNAMPLPNGSGESEGFKSLLSFTQQIARGLNEVIDYLNEQERDRLGQGRTKPM